MQTQYGQGTTRTLIGVFILFLLLSTGAQTNAQQVRMQSPPLNEQTQGAIIDSVSFALNDRYVFSDVAKAMEQLIKDKFKKGEYKSVTGMDEFTFQLTTDLQSVSHDKHLRINPTPPPDPNSPAPPTPEEAKKQQLERMQKDNFGFKKVEILPGNIGYIDFRYFAETSQGDASATAIAAMNFLAHVDAIIFDMRQNGGGSPSMIQLITSYLFDESVHLNDFYIRKSNETNQFWTQGQVQGPKLSNVPVFVLTSNYTFSGAEEFSYNLKNLKRGTIIGETTGGGAHPVDNLTYDSLHIVAFIPFGRAINPITKTNWEGTGVEPDIKVSAPEALLTARIEALKSIASNEKNEGIQRQLNLAVKKLQIEQTPITLDKSSLKLYAGEYGPRKVTAEKGDLYYQREGRPKFKLIPLGDDTFGVEGIETFNIKFNRDKSGNVVEFVGMYENGIIDSNQRSN